MSQYPPGYNQPGMYAPAPPGFFGSTAQGLGVGSQTFHQQGMAQQAGSSMFAGGAVSAMSSVPTGLAAGVGAMGLVAPMMAAGYGSGSMGAMAWNAVDQLDPTTHMFSAGGSGARVGYGMGARFSGLSSRIPTGQSLGTAIRGAFLGESVGMQAGAAHMFRGGGMRAGMGMLGRAGIAGGMGVGGALTAAAAPLAVGMAAYKGIEYAGRQFGRGGQNTMQGQALMAQMGHTLGAGQTARGTGREAGKMMQEMATDMGASMEDIGRYAKDLDSQKTFQTTRSAKEFRTKFKSVMKAVKEIAEATKGSVDDAVKMFGDLRTQGFYTTGDIKAQAVSRQAREMTTGISKGVFSAVGGAGAQIARQHGMRGRFGSRMAERSVAGVAMGVRSGRMSEEEVEEMGGAEQVGLRLASSEMRFMKSARGKAMIAYTMGKDGSVDSGRMQKMLGGQTSIEDIVTGAAGRGLGVLQKAGTREAREAASPYAGMQMVKMAMAQEKQLYGRNTRSGTLAMLGTMGHSREEAELRLQKELGQAQQHLAEQTAKGNISVDAADARKRETSFTARMRSGLDRNVGQGLRAAGAGTYAAAQSLYSGAVTSLTGDETYTGGDQALARRFTARGDSGGHISALTRGTENNPWLGGMSASRRLQHQYRDLGASSAEGLGMTEEQLQAGLADGSVKDLGVGVRERAKDIISTNMQWGTFGLLGSIKGETAEGQQYVKTKDVEDVEAAYTRGRETGATTEGLRDFRLAAGGRGDFMEKMCAKMQKAKARAGKARAGGGHRGDFMGGLMAIADMAGVGFVDITGNDADFDKKFATFTAAQNLKIIDDKMDYEGYLATSHASRSEVQGKVTAALDEAVAAGDTGVAKTLRTMIGSSDSKLLDTANLQTARDSFGKLLADEFTSKFGTKVQGRRHHGAGGDKKQISSSQSALAKELTKEGPARAAYDGLMRAIASGDTDAQLAFQEDLKAALPDDGTALRGVEEQVEALQSSPGVLTEAGEAHKESYSDGAGGLIGAYAAINADADTMAGDKARITAMDKSHMSIAQRGMLKRMQDGGLNEKGMQTRGKARKDLLRDMITGAQGKDGSALSEQEIMDIDALGGGGQGSALAGIISGLEAGDLFKDEKSTSFLKAGGGVTDDDIKRVQEMEAGAAKQEAMANLLDQGGLSNFGAYEDSSAKKGKRSVQAEYIKANDQFVVSVHAFVRALTAAGIEGVPKLEAVGAGQLPQPKPE